MARITFKGLEKYSAKLVRLSARLDDQILGAAIHDGADIVINSVIQHLEAVPTDDTHPHEKLSEGPSSEAKQAVKNAYGIAPLQMDEKGFLNVKIGVGADYYGPPTPKYPKGRPVTMLARSIISGTSWMKPHPYVKQAVRQSRKAAEAAMKKRVETEIEKIMK